MKKEEYDLEFDIDNEIRNYNNRSSEKSESEDYTDELPKEIVELLLNTHPLREKKEEVSERVLKSRASYIKPKEESKKAPMEYKSDKKNDDVEYDVREAEEIDSDSDEIEDENDNEGNVFGFKVALTIIIPLFIICVSILVYMLNTSKNAVIEANNEIKTKTETITSLEEAKLENLSLKEEIEKLKAASTLSETKVVDDQPLAPTPSAQTESTDINMSDVKYTVVKGDNLWKVSKKFYGNTEYVEKIMKANNIKNGDVLPFGKEIIIPKK